MREMMGPLEPPENVDVRIFSRTALDQLGDFLFPTALGRPYGDVQLRAKALENFRKLIATARNPKLKTLAEQIVQKVEDIDVATAVDQAARDELDEILSQFQQERNF